MHPTVFDHDGHYLYNVPSESNSSGSVGIPVVVSANLVPVLEADEIEAFRKDAEEVFDCQAQSQGLHRHAFDGAPLFDFIGSSGDRTLVVYLDDWSLLQHGLVQRLQRDLLSRWRLWRVLFTVPDRTHREDMTVVYPDTVRIGRDDEGASWQSRLSRTVARQNEALKRTQHAKRAELRTAVDVAVEQGLHQSPPRGVKLLTVLTRPAMAEGFWQVWIASRVDVKRSFDYSDSVQQGGGYVLKKDGTLGELRTSLGRTRRSDCCLSKLFIVDSQPLLAMTFKSEDGCPATFTVSRSDY